MFGALYLLGCLNGLFGRFIQATRADGPLAAALSIDINVIVFFACFAGLSVMFSTVDQGVGDQRIRGLDIVAAVFFLILVALPIYPLSWVAVTGLSLYVVLCARDNSDRVRAAIILFALAVPMFWSRLLFQLFAKSILDIDAALVATVLDSVAHGKHGAVCRWFRFHDRPGAVLIACEYVVSLSLLGQHLSMGWASVVSRRFLVVWPRMFIRRCRQRHAHQSNGVGPNILQCNP